VEDRQLAAAASLDGAKLPDSDEYRAQGDG